MTINVNTRKHVGEGFACERPSSEAQRNSSYGSRKRQFQCFSKFGKLLEEFLILVKIKRDLFGTN